MGGLSCENGRHKHAQMQIRESLRPPEGGWGWMVAFGMAVIFVSCHEVSDVTPMRKPLKFMEIFVYV